MIDDKCPCGSTDVNDVKITLPVTTQTQGAASLENKAFVMRTCLECSQVTFWKL